MRLDLPKQGERDWYKKFTKALNDVANTLVLDGSNRNYTLTNGATKSTAADALYVWQEKSMYMDRIYGVGKVKFPAMNGGNNIGVVLPYDIAAGDFTIGSVFTYDFKPYFSMDPNNGQLLIYTDVALQANEYWINFMIGHYKG